MKRQVISPAFVYLFACLICIWIGRYEPLGAEIGFCFFFFLWLIEQLALIAIKSYHARQYVLAECTARASLFFRRFGARLLPGGYPAMLLIADLNTYEGILVDQQRFDEALALSQEAVKVAISKFKEGSGEHVAQMINQSYVLGMRGDAEQAERIAEKAVNMLEPRIKSLSKVQAENLCLALNNLGVMYVDQRKVDKALAAFEKSINLKATVFGANTEAVALGYSNQGYALLKAEKYEAAEQFIRRALKLISEKGSVEGPLVPTLHNNLGEALRGQGKLDESEHHLWQSCKQRMVDLTPQHPHMGYSYHNLGSLYADKGDKERASEYFKKAVEIRKIHPGARNAELNDTLKRYGEFLRKNGDDAEAQRLESAITSLPIKKQKAQSGTYPTELVGKLLVAIVILLPLILLVSGAALRVVSLHGSR